MTEKIIRTWDGVEDVIHELLYGDKETRNVIGGIYALDREYRIVDGDFRPVKFPISLIINEPVP